MQNHALRKASERATPPADDRTINCLNNAIAMDASLNGRLAQALPNNGVNSLNDLKNYVGNWGEAMRGFSHIENMMADLGPGATGIIAGQRRLFGTIPRAGHMFNVYVDAAGVVRFADGTADVKLSGFSQLRLFLTNTP